MNYENMSNFEINLLVYCVVEKVNPVGAYKTDGWFDIAVLDEGEHYGHKDIANYCDNASHAWDIIVENEINLDPRRTIKKLPWMASAGDQVYSIDKNPLRAAMICFLKMKDQSN